MNEVRGGDDAWRARDDFLRHDLYHPRDQPHSAYGVVTKQQPTVYRHRPDPRASSRETPKTRRPSTTDRYNNTGGRGVGVVRGRETQDVVYEEHTRRERRFKKDEAAELEAEYNQLEDDMGYDDEEVYELNNGKMREEVEDDDEGY